MDFDNDLGTVGNVAIISPLAGNVTFSGTSGIVPPSGTTGQRPGSPVAGTYRYNSTINDIELWNGTTWAPMTGTNSVISFTISGWTLVSGNLYYADVVHNMSTQIMAVSLWNTATNTLVDADSIVSTSTSTIRITVAGNTNTIRCVIVTAGQFTGYTTSNLILRTLTYYASSLDSPNNSDWAVNSLAAAIADPTNPGLTVRQFSNTTEQGVGFNLTVPAGATNITFRFKGRAQTAPGSAAVVQPKLYLRSIPDNAAVSAWSTAYAFSNISIPTNAYFQYSYQTFTLASLGLASNGLYQAELSRSTTVSGGTQLASNWYLNELTIEFT